MQMWIFLIVIFLFTAAWCTYLGFRLIKPLGLSPARTKFLRVIMYLPLLIPAVFFLRRWIENDTLNLALEATIMTSLAFYSFLLGLGLLRDLAFFIFWIPSKILRKPEWSFFASREILKSSSYSIIGASVLMVGLGLFNALSVPAVREVEIPVAGLHPDLRGFRIVQLSDLHADDLKRKKVFDKITETVTRLHPDLTVITGDLADGPVKTIAPKIESLKKLPEPVYFITGNHEYYSDWESWKSLLETFHFHLLLDQNTIIQHGEARIMLAGVTDPGADRSGSGQPRGVEVAVQGAPAADYRILLAHQPGEVFDAEKHGFDLQLSGHTHGGQFFPWNYAIGLFHPYVRGLNRHGKMWIYVSQGTGFWGPPIRLGTRSEITLLTLRSDEG